MPVIPNEMGWLIALGSIIVNLILTVISVRVQGAISEVKINIAEVKIDVEKVRTEMQTLRASMLERQYETLSQIAKDMRSGFVDRETSLTMHAEHGRRIDIIEARLADLRAAGGTA